MEQVVIIGGGYAGLRAVKQLIKAKLPVEITLVNKNSYHYDSTQLHRVAVGTKEPDEISFEIKEALAKNVKFVQAEVDKVDQTSQTVILKDNQTLHYDYLFNALGFESETFGIPGVDEYSYSIVDIDTALAARKRLEDRLANYQTSHDPDDLSIVVCGAGFTSIEYLGELTYRLPELAKKYHFNVSDVKITCLEATPKVLPMFSQELVDYAIKYLKDRGVKILTSTPITEITSNSALSKGKVYSANTIIWTTGVRGSHVIADSGYDQKRDRVVVEPDSSIKNYNNEFLIGDVSAVPNPANGRLYPTTAQISIAEADNAVQNLANRFEKKGEVNFTYESMGTVCSLGPTDGVAEVTIGGHQFKIKGRFVAPLKKMVAKRSVGELTNLKLMLQS